MLYCSALRGRTLTGGGLSFESSVAGERHTRSIFENCMVKNFHVSNMKAVRTRISVRVRMQFQRKR